MGPKKNVKSSMYRGILAPVVTEKAYQGGGVVLYVNPDLDKLQIREAVEAVFDVKVKGVRTSNVRGKVKGVYGRSGRRKDRKKAYITLQEGHSIEIIEGI